MSLLENFLKYVSIDTQSDENSLSTPSTFKQFDLLNYLKSQLDEMHIPNELTKEGRLYAHIDGNNDYDCIGMCAHVDTALECSGANVKPQIIKNYDGKDISLGNSGLVLSLRDFPFLNQYIGKTLITTDGTTLLGADDKAGVAIIMNIAKEVLNIPVNKRRPMSILFTPDEEVGRGPEHFDPQKFNCKYAYTFDGAGSHYISIENFNARSISVDIIGKSIHPGSAKGIMINAALVLTEFISLLPSDEVPSKTEKREGFHHLNNIQGDVEHSHADFIIRNHDADILNRQCDDFLKIKQCLIEKYPSISIDVVIKDQYRNMYEVIKKHPNCVTHLENVYKKLGIEYEYEPTRGGTDGATFSFMGVPCPNIGTGSWNHHGKYEFAILEDMELMSLIGLNLLKIE